MTNLQFAVKVFKRALKFSSTGRQDDSFSHMRNLDEALEEAIKAYNLCQQNEIEEIIFNNITDKKWHSEELHKNLAVNITNKIYKLL